MRPDDVTSEQVATDEDPAAARLLDVARALLATPSIAGNEWAGITAAATIAWSNPPQVRPLLGWHFSSKPKSADDGWEAIHFEPEGDLSRALIGLARTMAERDETRPWNHCLIQIDRATMGLVTKFSYDEQGPWQPDLSRLGEWVEALRPTSG